MIRLYGIGVVHCVWQNMAGLCVAELGRIVCGNTWQE